MGVLILMVLRLALAAILSAQTIGVQNPDVKSDPAPRQFQLPPDNGYVQVNEKLLYLLAAGIAGLFGWMGLELKRGGDERKAILTKMAEIQEQSMERFATFSEERWNQLMEVRQVLERLTEKFSAFTEESKRRSQR